MATSTLLVFLFAILVPSTIILAQEGEDSEIEEHLREKRSVVKCNFTTQGGFRCTSCKQARRCYRFGMATLTTCSGGTPYCRNGFCSSTKGALCYGTTSTTTASTTISSSSTSGSSSSTSGSSSSTSGSSSSTSGSSSSTSGSSSSTSGSSSSGSGSSSGATESSSNGSTSGSSSSGSGSSSDSSSSDSATSATESG